ncbi:hypothetical protein EDD18DRAFT_1067222, partial [Armillaria luteobubalina]
PQYKKRGECPHCKVMESMEHVLVDCNIDGQNVLWQLARELWENHRQKWIPQTLGIALGSTLVQVKTKEEKTKLQPDCNYILITETVHMIWKVRCQW